MKVTQMSDFHLKSVRDYMTKTPSGFKRLNADIPEELFKEFAKRCIEEGVSKKEFLVQLLEKELFKDSKK
ncbi:hypothetical protein [Priestia megaterium]|jgi:hypothetical protein